jgi:hypothetical protein
VGGPWLVVAGITPDGPGLAPASLASAAMLVGAVIDERLMLLESIASSSI